MKNNMKFLILFFILAFTCSMAVSAQKVFTKNGSITFFSKSPLENISADNNQVMSVLNKQNGEMQFSVLVKSFRFKKALMEEHFNENYLESDKYPKAIFKGIVEVADKLDISKDGTYKVKVSGDMTIHGVTKKVSVPGTLTSKEGVVTGNTVFNLKLADYNISIPKLVKDNIAEVIEIIVDCVYDQKL
ncbi:MAG: YceI family protein [Ferruginibacter sp.]